MGAAVDVVVLSSRWKFSREEGTILVKFTLPVSLLFLICASWKRVSEFRKRRLCRGWKRRGVHRSSLVFTPVANGTGIFARRVVVFLQRWHRCSSRLATVKRRIYLTIKALPRDAIRQKLLATYNNNNKGAGLCRVP